MEDEGQSLRWGQRLQHDLQGEADRVGQQRFILRLMAGLRADDGVGHADLERVLAAAAARAQHVQADAGDDRGEPAAQVVDVGCAGPADPQPGVLDCVVGVSKRAQQPVGDRAQLGAVLFEAIG
jgi:hypothetical protein